MKQELAQKLYKDFPLLYGDHDKSMMQTCMCWGVETGDGWYNLIYNLSSKLEPLISKFYKDNYKLIRCSCCMCDREDHYGSARANPGKCLAVRKCQTKYIYTRRGGWGEHWWQRKYYTAKQKIVNVINKIYGLFYYKLNTCWCEKFEPCIPRAMQVKEKYGCYDEQTEVLTDKGWKFFRDITKEDKIACLKQEQYLDYVSPTDIISYRYDGDMYRLKTRGVDLLVTPNHNLYVAKGSYYNGRYDPPKKKDYPFELTTYEKFFGKNKRFKKSAVWNKEEIQEITIPGYSYTANMILTNKIVQNKYISRKYIKPEMKFFIDNFFKFLGWYVAEGCSSKSKGDIRIACNNTDGGIEKEIIANILDSCDIKIKTSMEDKSALTFNIYSKVLASWLSDNCGANSYLKKIPDCIKNASARQIRLFLESLFSGDGHKAETSYILTTVSKQLSDDVQECILKAGDVARIYKPRNHGPMQGIGDPTKTYNAADRYEINWLTDSQDHNTQNKGLSSSSVERLEEYHGQVYCVTVPEHIIYVRRNGIPVWCGNSLRFYMTHSTDDMDDLIGEAEKESAITCETCGQPGVLRNDYGWFTTLCDTCAVRKNGTKILPDDGGEQ